MNEQNIFELMDECAIVHFYSKRQYVKHNRSYHIILQLQRDNILLGIRFFFIYYASKKLGKLHFFTEI